jgi:thioredoxin reductase
MFLKSVDFATSIYTPRKGYSLIDWCQKTGQSSAEPLSMDLFSRYGLWAQEQLVPHLEQAEVTRLAQTRDLFEIDVAHGETVTARRVVMATGLAYFAFLPKSLRDLPRELVSHTSQNREYDSFRDKEVVVLGGGQSALEAAVMIHEAGGHPQLMTRCSVGASFANPPAKKRILRHRILHPMSVLGPSRIGFFLQRVPHGFHYLLSDPKRVELTRKLYGPWGSWWLAPRFKGKVPVVINTEVVSATPQGGRLALKLRNRADGTERELVVDHLVAGTGYEPDLDVIPFLDKGLISRIRRLERSPKLSASFESSVPGLYFVGASAAFSFGPLLRFVAGAEFTAPTVGKHLARSSVKATSSVPMPVPSSA